MNLLSWTLTWPAELSSLPGIQPFCCTSQANSQNRDTFQFFLYENSLQLDPLGEDVEFVLVQFVEIGGDHLDLLMRHQTGLLTGTTISPYLQTDPLFHQTQPKKPLQTRR